MKRNLPEEINNVIKKINIPNENIMEISKKEKVNLLRKIVEDLEKKLKKNTTLGITTTQRSRRSIV